MKILLTGANGYIGKRLLPVLLDNGHDVVCCVRNAARLDVSEYDPARITVVEVDFSAPVEAARLPRGIDAAYYLIHSMATSGGDFQIMEKKTAGHFVALAEALGVKQVIYLGGIVNDKNLSKHLQSRKNVENILDEGSYSLTVLRAGIIVGSGSASFEIIRDLVEKLPVMVAPKWLLTRSQPIAIRDVVRFLHGVLGNEKAYNRTFDIGGPEILTYREMLLQYADVRNLNRLILIVPVLTPRLSSYWLYFVTSTTFRLAKNLVDSMKNEVVAADNTIHDLVKGEPITYHEAVELAFQRIEQNMVYSSWKDSFSSTNTEKEVMAYLRVPSYGCFKDRKQRMIRNDPQQVLDNIWSIGGERGWYYANILWKIRGLFDKMVGGVGLRRGRTNIQRINRGDALDFWRVIAADRGKKRLLLYAEMKLPGEAWLEFRIDRIESGKSMLVQEATFRPKGLTGRIYWFAILPFHLFIFNGMIRNIERYGKKQ